MDDVCDRLGAAYRDLAAVLLDLSDAEAGRPTGCAGWAVLDLAQHLVADARRGLVALATPTEAPATIDAVEYWRQWQQSRDEAADGPWRTRVVASVAGGITTISRTYAEASAAVLVSASRVDGGSRVSTQGHVITVTDLLDTLATETVVHHLDLVVDLERPGPAEKPLAGVNHVLATLLGRPLPASWHDGTAVRRCTGREVLSPQDREDLGDAVDLLPLFS